MGGGIEAVTVAPVGVDAGCGDLVEVLHGRSVEHGDGAEP